MTITNDEQKVNVPPNLISLLRLYKEETFQNLPFLELFPLYQMPCERRTSLLWFSMLNKDFSCKQINIFKCTHFLHFVCGHKYTDSFSSANVFFSLTMFQGQEQCFNQCKGVTSQLAEIFLKVLRSYSVSIFSNLSHSSFPYFGLFQRR